jgi:hypothetical protein
MEVETQMEQLITRLQATQKQVSALLESVAASQDWRPDPKEWSFRYIAAHLATVEKDCYLDRVQRIVAQENPFFESYFNTGWDFSQPDLGGSLAEWRDARQELIEFVRALPEDKWSYSGTHERFGTITLVDVLQGMLDHDQEHLEHLEQLVAELGMQLLASSRVRYTW